MGGGLNLYSKEGHNVSKLLNGHIENTIHAQISLAHK